MRYLFQSRIVHLWRKRVFPVLVLQATCGCGAKMESSSRLDGHYPVERTVVATMSSPRASTTPALLDATGRRSSYGLTLSTAGLSSALVRVTTEEGCSFIANVDKSGNVSANDIDCDPLGKNSVLWVSGAQSRTVLSFSFDPKEGIYREHASVSLRGADPSQPDVPLKRFSVAEGHLTNWPHQAGVFIVKYDGDAQDSVLQPEAIQQATAPGCTALVGQSWTSGSLFVRYGEDKNELVVYEEGVGCTVHAKSIA